MKVETSALYNASFYYKVPQESNFSGDATIALQSSSGDVLASATVPISGSQTEWTQVAAELTPSSSAGDVNNVFTVTLDGAAAAGLTIDFALFSLFPPTFKDRPNGLRPDIAQALVDMGPSFFRLPGGNNLVGYFLVALSSFTNAVFRKETASRPDGSGTRPSGASSIVLGKLLYFPLAQNIDNFAQSPGHLGIHKH